MNDLLIYLVRSAACLLLFYGVYWLVLRKETFFALNRAFLVGAAVLSLALPLVRVPSPFFRTVVYASELSSPASLALPVGGALAPATQTSVLLSCALGLYAAGAGVFLVLLSIRLGRLAALARRCEGERRRGLRLIVGGPPGESFSFFNAVFLKETDLPAVDLDRILTHELAHVRQGHSFDIILAEILTVIQWFNPFVWPYKRSLRETHEYLADRAVIAQGCSPVRYQLLLVEQHVGGRLVELASRFRTSRIKRRIAMLTKQETKGLARWKPLLILPLAVALVLAFAESRTVIKEGQEQTGGSKAATQERSSDEQMLKALQEKTAQLQLMKQKLSQAMADLDAKLKETNDPADKERIQAEMRSVKAKSLEVQAKALMLEAKGTELALKNESDPAKKVELEHKLQELKVKLGDTIDATTRAEVKAEFDEQQLKAVEMKVKEGRIHLEALEAALAKETDPAKRDELKKAVMEVKLETEQVMKKAEALQKAYQEKLAAAEKKAEKK
jgi:hypothetical protein